MTTFALQTEQKALVETVLWFANLKRIRSTKQVEQRFAQLPLVPGVFQIIEEENLAAYQQDQAELRRWLEIITKSAAKRRNVANEIANRLAQTVTARLSFSHGRLVYVYGITGVQAACALGIAFMLDETLGLSSRLKQCGNPECLRFNLDLLPKGRPRRFCSEECKKRADLFTGAERVRRHRQKKKKQTSNAS